MGREIRRVIPEWEHPRNEKGRYIPLLDGSFAAQAAEWDESDAQWNTGLRPRYYHGHPEMDLADAIRAHGYDSALRTEWVPPGEMTDPPINLTWEDYSGPRPVAADYRPDWPDADATWVELYETVSEGTPVSPAFASKPELRAWLLANGDDWSSAPPSADSLDLLMDNEWAPTFIGRAEHLAPWEQQANIL